MSGGSATGRATRAPSSPRPGKLVALEEEGQRNADRAGEDDRRERDPEAGPERLPLGRARRELGDVRERPVRRAERLGERQDERVADEPEEQQRQQRRGEPAPRAAQRFPREHPRRRAVRARARRGRGRLRARRRARRAPRARPRRRSRRGSRRRGRRSAARRRCLRGRGGAGGRRRPAPRAGPRGRLRRPRRGRRPAVAGQTGPPAIRAPPFQTTGTTLERPMKVATKRVAGRSKSSSGVPSCSRRPSLSTATRSPSSNASSCSWVTKSVVMPTLPDRALQLAARLLAQRRVQVRQRLVEQQHARVGRERAGQRHALLLAAGDRGHAAVLEAGEARERQHLGDARPRGARAAPPAAEAEGDVLAHGHVRKERVVLEHHAEAPPLRGQRGDVLALDEDPARVRGLEAGDQAQHGRLAAAGGPEQRDDLALRGGEGDLARDGERAEALLERLEAEELGHPGAVVYAHETSARDIAASERHARPQRFTARPRRPCRGRGSSGPRWPSTPRPRARRGPSRSAAGTISRSTSRAHDGQRVAEVRARRQAERLLGREALHFLLAEELDELLRELRVAAAGDEPRPRRR